MAMVTSIPSTSPCQGPDPSSSQLASASLICQEELEILLDPTHVDGEPPTVDSRSHMPGAPGLAEGTCR
jgi:hypothetical protein